MRCKYRGKGRKRVSLTEPGLVFPSFSRVSCFEVARENRPHCSEGLTLISTSFVVATFVEVGGGGSFCGQGDDFLTVI